MNSNLLGEGMAEIVTEPAGLKPELEFMQRYREQVPDWGACIAALQRPLPVTVWTNTLKITPQALQPLLESQGYKVTALPWHHAGFVITPLTKATPALGRSWLYLSGLLQIQEQASMLAGYMMEAAPGECILDLCAAPGNKTGQIAVAMQNKGTLIANDRNYERMRALGQIHKRLGWLNVSCTTYDGLVYPAPAESFDRILVDAPCSCQGTTRKRKHNRVTTQVPAFLRLAHAQRGLLARAFALLKPGGRIVYSTCTYAPEENEAVVDWALRRYAGQMAVDSISVPGLVASPGLTCWQGTSFLPQLAQTMRIWPHQNDSGGFYIAVLTKVAPKLGQSCKVEAAKATTASVNGPSTTMTSFNAIPSHFRNCFVARFGFAEKLFADYIYHATARGWYILDRNHRVPSGINHEPSGLFLLKTRAKYPKLTTTAAMLLGAHATTHIVRLQYEQVIRYIRQHEIELLPAQLELCQSGGYVLVQYLGLTLGLGLLRMPRAGQATSVRLESLFPKSWQGGTK